MKCLKMVAKQIGWACVTSDYSRLKCGIFFIIKYHMLYIIYDYHTVFYCLVLERWMSP